MHDHFRLQYFELKGKCTFWTGGLKDTDLIEIRKFLGIIAIGKYFLIIFMNRLLVHANSPMSRNERNSQLINTISVGSFEIIVR